MSIVNVQDALQTGKMFPPKSEYTRMCNSFKYESIFNGRVDLIFPELKQRLERNMLLSDGKIKKFFESINVKFGMSIPKKFSDLMFGRLPTVVHEENEALDKEINRLLRKCKFWKNIKLAYIDSYKFGNGAFKVYNKDSNIENGIVKDKLIPAICPLTYASWCPVVDKSNQFDVVGYLTGSVYDVATEEDVEDYNIEIEYNQNGKFTSYLFQCSNPDINGIVTLGAQLPFNNNDKDIPIENNRVKLLTNFGTTNTGIYGISAYETYYLLIGQLIERISQVAKILDEHATPVMKGPKSILDYNEDTGEWTFNRSAYIGLDSTEAGIDVGYVTWDGKLTDNVEQMNRITMLILSLSETGSAFLDLDAGQQGFAESARALKIRHKSPIASCNAWISDNKDVILEAVADVCKIAGMDINSDDLEMNWKPNLPEDELEKAQIFTTLMASGFSFEEQFIRDGFGSRDGAKEERKQKLLEDKEKAENTNQPEEEQKGLDKRKSGLRGLSVPEQDTPESKRKSNDQSGSPNKAASK